jgi:hypothetical protein
MIFRNVFIHLFVLLDMALSIVIIGVVALVVAIYLIFELKRMKHKIFAIFLIGLILFGFFSFNAVFSGKELKIESMSDLENVVKVYFNWLGYTFNNVKIITSNVVKMNWKGNQTS